MNKLDEERYRIMKKMILSDTHKVLLDIGAGFNPISKGVSSKKTITVDGEKRFKPSIICDINLPLPIKTGSVDIVIAGEIIEHLINPFLFLLEIHRVLKRGGQLVLSTPNICCLKNRLLVLFGRMPANNARAYPSKETQWFYHKSDFNLAWIQTLLKGAGFKIEEIKSNGIIIKNTIFLRGEICPPSLGEILVVRAIKNEIS